MSILGDKKTKALPTSMCNQRDIVSPQRFQYQLPQFRRHASYSEDTVWLRIIFFSYQWLVF